MSDDVMADWKNKRFVIVGEEISYPDKFLVVLADYMFWGDHIDELQEWCNTYDVDLKGMTVSFNQESVLTAFCLRWS